MKKAAITALSTGPVFRRIIMLSIVALMALGFLLPEIAVAQERRTLLQMLFGRPREPAPVYDDEPVFRRPLSQDQQQQPENPRPRKQRAKTVRPPPEPPAPVIAKLDTAKKVLVVGDFMAGSLGDGLNAAFETSANIVVETRDNGSSGMVRDDYFDWPKALPGFIDEVKPSLIVISLGANDRQQMKIDGTREKFRTDRWTAEYTRRVAAFAALAAQSKIPFLWVGLPAFQSTAMTADMVTFNGIYRAEAEKAGGQFVDIWDGFVDEDGKFVLTGSDMNGQQVRLRGADGINLTKAGKRKLAFYVEKDIRRLLGDAVLSGSDVPGTEGLKDLVVTTPAVDQVITETPPISLTDPDLDGGAQLMSGTTPLASTGKTPRDLLVEKGEIAVAPAGRVDDFRLAKPETVISNPVIRN